MRIARFLAAAGLGSRRHCEQLLQSRCVTVNGERITDPARNINPELDQIAVDGIRANPLPLQYILLYKPAGVTCSNQDCHADKLIIDLLPRQSGRLFTIGRLDRDSEGLIICTNDGKISQRIAHPSHGLTKTYRVYVKGKVPPDALPKMRRGIFSEGDVLKPEKVHIVTTHFGNPIVTELEFVLKEGKNREIRRLCQGIGVKIIRLRRIAIGPLRDPKLTPGQWRPLRTAELARLFAAE